MKFQFPNYYDSADERHESINKPVLLFTMFQHSNGAQKYGHVSLRPVYTYTRADGVRTYDFYSDHMGEHVLYWLTMWGQINWYEADCEPYAIRLVYNSDDVFTIEGRNFPDFMLEKAAFLKRLASRFDKISEKRGMPADFAEYAQRFGEILGCEYFIVDNSVGNSYPRVFRYIESKDIARVIRSALQTKEIGY